MLFLPNAVGLEYLATVAEESIKIQTMSAIKFGADNSNLPLIRHNKNNIKILNHEAL